MSDVLERFLRYVKIDTQSDDDSGLNPSTAKQHDLARILYEELKDMGFTDDEIANRYKIKLYDEVVLH